MVNPTTSTGPNPGQALPAISARDLESLNVVSQVGKNRFFPTGALIGLYRIVEISSPQSSFNIFFVMSGIGSLESPDRARRQALALALDALGTLEEPLALVSKAGDVHSKEWTLTPKGRAIADALNRNATRDERYMLGYQEVSLRVLRRLLAGSASLDSSLPDGRRGSGGS